MLPASRLFSRSSFVAVERSMTTWPEQILWTEAESICLIVPVISSTQMLPQLVHLSGSVMTRNAKTSGFQKDEVVRGGFSANSPISRTALTGASGHS